MGDTNLKPEEIPVNIIVAYTEKERAIAVIDSESKFGFPWETLALDLRLFREKTTDSVCLIGKNTADTFKGKFPPNRFYVILTENKELLKNIDCIKDTIYAGSIQEGLKIAREYALTAKKKEVWVIGGGKIYDEILNTPEISEMISSRKLDADIIKRAFEKLLENKTGGDESALIEKGRAEFETLIINSIKTNTH
jgi:dihydrofolate reductase